MRARVERNLAVAAPALDELGRQLWSDSEKLIFSITDQHKGRSWQASKKLGVMISLIKMVCVIFSIASSNNTDYCCALCACRRNLFEVEPNV